MLALLIELGKAVVTAVVGAVAEAFVSRIASSATSLATAAPVAVSTPAVVPLPLSDPPASHNLTDVVTEANLHIATARIIETERTEAEFVRKAELSNTDLQLHRLKLLEQGMLNAYALPSFGYLRNRLPQDDVPAVFVSDVYWPDPNSAWVRPFGSIKLFIKDLEDRGVCHDATLLPPQWTMPIISSHQAAEICSIEFPSRPAIVIFHAADKLELNSYLLLWRPSESGGTAATLHVGRTTHYNHVSAADEAVARLVETLTNEPGDVGLERLWSIGAIPVMASGAAERFALLPMLTAIATSINDFGATIHGRPRTADLASALRTFYSSEPDLATAVSTTFSTATQALHHMDRGRTALRQLAESNYDATLSIEGAGIQTIEVRFHAGGSAILRLESTRVVPLVSVCDANGSSTRFDLSVADWEASEENYVSLVRALEKS